MAPHDSKPPLRTLTAALATAILGVFGLGITAAATSPAAVAESNGTVLPEPSALPQVPEHGPGLSQRIITWSGYRWLVYPPGQVGPEHTELASALANVHVDSRGRLHLAITDDHGTWRCAELELLTPVTYGTYSWVVDTATADFAPQTVLGMFVYRPGSGKLRNEIDIEDSRFIHLIAPDNAQFAVQPYYAPGHYKGYAIDSSLTQIYQQFKWLPPVKPGDHGTVYFETHAGSSRSAPLVSDWTYGPGKNGYSVPTPYNEHLFIDLWLNTARPPVGGTYAAVIKSFHFSPAG